MLKNLLQAFFDTPPEVSQNGISLLQNNGFVQEIKHYHLHLKPYYKNKISIEMVKHNELISNVTEIYELLK